MAHDDRHLRRMVAKLQDLAVDDFDAIVAQLDLPQRRRVLLMLDQLRGASSQPDCASVSEEPGQKGWPPGMSPWLIERIDGRDLVGAAEDGNAITEYARQALRRRAGALLSQPQEHGRSASLVTRVAEKYRVWREGLKWA
jgi:hypothetical protein